LPTQAQHHHQHNEEQGQDPQNAVLPAHLGNSVMGMANCSQLAAEVGNVVAKLIGFFAAITHAKNETIPPGKHQGEPAARGFHPSEIREAIDGRFRTHPKPPQRQRQGDAKQGEEHTSLQSPGSALQSQHHPRRT